MKNKYTETMKIIYYGKNVCLFVYFTSYIISVMQVARLLAIFPGKYMH